MYTSGYDNKYNIGIRYTLKGFYINNHKHVFVKYYYFI